MHTIEKDGWALIFNSDLSGEAMLRSASWHDCEDAATMGEGQAGPVTVRIPGALLAAMVERKVDEELERRRERSRAADYVTCSRCKSKVTWCYAARSGNICGSCWDAWSNGTRTDGPLEEDVAHARRRKDLAPDGG